MSYLDGQGWALHLWKAKGAERPLPDNVKKQLPKDYYVMSSAFSISRWYPFALAKLESVLPGDIAV